MITRFYLFAFGAMLLSACGQQTKEPAGKIVTTSSTASTLSTDTAVLSKLMDIRVFKPSHATFYYRFHDNTAQKERLSIPGPSDSYLEAVLYFDSTTFRQLQSKYFTVDYSSPQFSKNDFNFQWLDTATRNELLRNDTSYHGHPDYFLGLGAKGKLWLLKDKVLVSKARD